MLRTCILDISIIQLNQNLMMNIRTLSRHKLAKWTNRKSKMAATAAILKIDFPRVHTGKAKSNSRTIQGLFQVTTS